MRTHSESSNSPISFVVPRLDAKPWGGHALRRFGLQFHDGVSIGEALVSANDTIISAGYGEGRTLGQVIADSPLTHLGQGALEVVGGRPLFPLLVKLIDATENLSIQVHPNDQQAEPWNQPGKTEAWHILDAQPGSKLFLGLADPNRLEDFVKTADRLDGSSAKHLRTVNAQIGATYLLPAGTVHALGAGVLVYEIQQPSDITYRLDDWGRVDSEGRPRTMHRKEGLAVLQPESQPVAIAPVDIPCDRLRRQALAATRFFALEKWTWTQPATATLPTSHGPQVFTLLFGSLTVNDQSMRPGQSCVVWPSTGSGADLESNDAVVLRGWIPDESDDVPLEKML